MPSQEPKKAIDLTVDRNNLYREESFTDIKVAAIRRLTPVNPDGSDDGTRKPIFMGQTQLMTESGPIILQSLLTAKTIEEAVAEFPVALQKEINKVTARAENHEHGKEK